MDTVTPEPSIRLLSIQTGQVQPLLIQGRNHPSAIRKRPAGAMVDVLPLGLAGDEQADPSVHGGRSKAVYAYPHEHYPFWRTVRGQAGAAAWDEALPPGAMGENLTLQGVLETQLWIGDRLQFPACTLVVSEPRMPCAKFNAVMGFAQAGKMMVQSGYCGFYLSVLLPGTLCVGDSAVVQPGPRELGLLELFRARRSGRG
jgi:MOSC domain-containing protein YiiM